VLFQFSNSGRCAYGAPEIGARVFIPKRHDRIWIGRACTLKDDVVIDVPRAANDDRTAIVLGHHTVIGRSVRLTAVAGCRLWVGDFATIQSHCQFVGEISIGRYCVLAPYVFSSSAGHSFREAPSWTIRDQDHHADAAARAKTSVIIGEDCWIGWGVVIAPGVEIGRGAVIGANSVVVKHVPPYSVHGGVPNKEIGKRLDFSPPKHLDAGQETDWPYFYSGFLMRKDEREAAGATDVLLARRVATVVMRGEAFTALSVAGRTRDKHEEATVEIHVNGQSIGTHSFSGIFDKTIPVGSDVLSRNIPAHRILDGYHEVTFYDRSRATTADDHAVLLDSNASYGLSRLAME